MEILNYLNARALSIFTLMLFMPCALYAENTPSSPPNKCEIKQAVWCILYSDVSYEDYPSIESGFASSWVIRGGSWRSYPLIIREPIGCRNGNSDATEVLGDVQSIIMENGEWFKIIVKLKNDNSCNMEFTYPSEELDPQRGGFFAAMNLIRACTNEVCEGLPIGARIRNKLREFRGH